MNWFITSVLALGISVFIPCAHAQEDTPQWRGPLPVENLRPYQSIFLHLSPESPTTLGRGQRRYGLQLDVANNLLIPATGAKGARVEEDFEVQRLRLSYRRGLKGGLEAGVTLPIVARNGGMLDGPIELYHRLLGLGGDGEDSPQGRGNIDRGRSVLFLRDADGNGVDEGRAFGIGDVSFSLKKTLSRGRFANSARIALKLPTASSHKILGSGGVDFGGGIDARYGVTRRLAIYGTVGALAFGNADAVPDARRSGLQGTLGLEYRGRRGSFVAQTDGATRNVRTGNSFADRTPVVVSVGYKRPVGKNRLFWVSFSENGDYHNFHAPFFGNIGPDFTLSTGFEWRR